MTKFAPIPRKRKQPPRGTPEHREFMRKLGAKGGKAGKGQAKNHWTPAEWKALQAISKRVQYPDRRT